MRRILIVLLVLVIVNTPKVTAGDGSGSVRAGYTILDEEGNQAVNYRSFNDYEGVGLSFEDVRYDFGNDLRLKADLKNITLNNRNLQLDVRRAGRFGAGFANSQYRRVYGRDGAEFTRRHHTGVSAWYYPHQFVKVYGRLARTSKSGRTLDFYQINPAENITFPTDYSQVVARAGVSINDRGRLFQFEYGGTSFDDVVDPTRDQSRSNLRVNLHLPIPGYEYVTMHAGFQRFRTEFSDGGFGLFSNTGWGGFTVVLPKGFYAKHGFVFNRAASDNELVATDNLSNAVYAGYSRPGRGGATVGYQQDLNDDLEDEVKGKSFYFSGWYRPMSALEFRGAIGSKVEDVIVGSRLIGNRDNNRHSVGARYRLVGVGSLALKYENRERDNDQLGSEVEFNRSSVDLEVADDRYGTLAVGYAYSTGDYRNIDEERAFEFRDHLVYGDVRTREYRSLTGGMGATYYRSQRDLDVESFSLRFDIEYRFRPEYRFNVIYDVHNFDDLIAADRYYTANIVEISVVRDISF